MSLSSAYLCRFPLSSVERCLQLSGKRTIRNISSQFSVFFSYIPKPKSWRIVLRLAPQPISVLMWPPKIGTAYTHHTTGEKYMHLTEENRAQGNKSNPGAEVVRFKAPVCFLFSFCYHPFFPFILRVIFYIYWYIK